MLINHWRYTSLSSSLAIGLLFSLVSSSIQAEEEMEPQPTQEPTTPQEPNCIQITREEEKYFIRPCPPSSTADQNINAETLAKLDALETRIALLETENLTLSNSINHLSLDNETLTNSINNLDLASINTRVDSLEANRSQLTDLENKLACITPSTHPVEPSDAHDIYFVGCNVHIRNGIGETASVNERGNLIIGYNEDVSFNGQPDIRTGSHNIVIGAEHTYSSYAGFVSGLNNAITGEYSSVTGGSFNQANGNFSSVSGGRGRSVFGDYNWRAGGSFSND